MGFSRSMSISRSKLSSVIAAFLVFFVCSVLVLHPTGAYADGDMQCSRSGNGDVECPSGTTPYDLSNPSPVASSVTSNIGSILGSGAANLIDLGGQGGGGIIEKVKSFISGLIPSLANLFFGELLKTIDAKGNINNLVSQFGNVQNQLQSAAGAVCGGGQSIGGSLLNLGQNMLAQSINRTGIGAAASNIKDNICSAVESVTGGSGPIGPIDTDSKGGKKIAECSQRMINQSTADDDRTKGGSLGCALAVSRILDCAGYGVGTHVDTVALYNALDSDPCYKKVDEGHITGSDAMGLQPGDVLVTKRASRAGHTGIYEGNGNIISNSSSGFQGSAKGTIQRNYTVDKWKSVTNRNPGGSAVFRRVCE